MRFGLSSTSGGRAADSRRTRSSAGGRSFLRVVLTIVSLITAGICFLILHEWRDAQRSLGWLPVTVTIEESSVTGSNGPDTTGPYRLHLRYRYDHAGASRSGTQFRLGAEDRLDDVAPLLRVAHQYQPGDRVPGFVDPADPDRAVLHPGGRRGYLVFAIIIAAVSLLAFTGLLATFRGRSATTDHRPRVRSIARRTDGRAVRIGLGVFFTIFLLIGGTLSWFITIEPMLRARTAKQWTEVDCRIIDSTVRTHHGSDSTTYSADVLFEYVIGDRTYRSNRADVRTGSSSDHRSYRRIVNQNPAGRRTTCFVNPADPYEAVLDRSAPPFWSISLIALLFPCIGTIGLLGVAVSGLRAARGPIAVEDGARSARDRSRGGDFDFSPNRRDPADRILRPNATRLGRVFGLIIIACFWNGIVYVLFISQLIPQWRSGFDIGTLFLTLFAVPFVAIGLLIIGAVGHSALALFNPRFTLELDHAPVRLGDSVTVTYRTSGRRMPMRALTFHLIGRESATYRHGSSTSTDNHDFFSEEIFRSQDTVQQPTGTLQLRIPSDAIPSFRSGNNQINWMIKVHGDIPRWPDVAQDYPIEVLPAEKSP